MTAMPIPDRKRIADEVIEILCNKLTQLPLPSQDENFYYESQHLLNDVTQDPLDIAEVTMDIEDAFGISFDSGSLGDPGLETIGEIIDRIREILAE